MENLGIHLNCGEVSSPTVSSSKSHSSSLSISFSVPSIDAKFILLRANSLTFSSLAVSLRVLSTFVSANLLSADVFSLRILDSSSISCSRASKHFLLFFTEVSIYPYLRKHSLTLSIIYFVPFHKHNSDNNHFYLCIYLDIQPLRITEYEVNHKSIPSPKTLRNIYLKRLYQQALLL